MNNDNQKQPIENFGCANIPYYVLDHESPGCWFLIICVNKVTVLFCFKLRCSHFPRVSNQKFQKRKGHQNLPNFARLLLPQPWKSESATALCNLEGKTEPFQSIYCIHIVKLQEITGLSPAYKNAQKRADFNTKFKQITGARPKDVL